MEGEGGGMQLGLLAYTVYYVVYTVLDTEGCIYYIGI